MKRIIGYQDGVETSIETDPITRKTTIGRFQDVEPILERNKKLQNMPEYAKAGIKKDWYHMGTIPNIVLEKWHNQGLTETVFLTTDKDMETAKRLLNSPEWKYLKATSGNV